MEDILELFRLTRLSLEGSMISDASCFTDCGIKEVHLPEHCLKTKQIEKKAESRAKKAGVQSCAGVPFKAVEHKAGQYPYTLQKFDSTLWQSYRGAYGNASEYLVILMGEREEAPETWALAHVFDLSRISDKFAH